MAIFNLYGLLNISVYWIHQIVTLKASSMQKSATFPYKNDEGNG